MSAAPPRADTGGPGAAVPGRWLGVNTRVEDRRKGLETDGPPGWYCREGDGTVVFANVRSGKERRVALTAPDGLAYSVTRSVEGCTGCGTFGGSHQPWHRNAFCDCDCHEPAADFVASILQAEIDRNLLARAQHPSYRRDEHEHAGLGVPPVQGERWGLFHRWGRALRRRIPSSGFYVASPGLQWGSERGPTGGAR